MHDAQDGFQLLFRTALPPHILRRIRIDHLVTQGAHGHVGPVGKMHVHWGKVTLFPRSALCLSRFLSGPGHKAFQLLTYHTQALHQLTCPYTHICARTQVCVPSPFVSMSVKNHPPDLNWTALLCADYWILVSISWHPLPTGGLSRCTDGKRWGRHREWVYSPLRDIEHALGWGFIEYTTVCGPQSTQDSEQ